MNCRAVTALIEGFADGELATDKVLEVEQHLEGCADCRERLRFEHALRTSLRSALSVPTTSDFEHRLTAALAAERSREQHGRREAARQQRPLGWRTIAPLAAAAAATLVWAASDREEAPQRAARGAAPTETRASSISLDSVDQLVDQLVDTHATDSAPEVTDTELARRFEPQVGVPVRVPAFHQYGMRWEGGSVVPVRDVSRAASLRYRLAGHRVTLYVYDARRLPLRVTLEPRVVRDVPVYVGVRRGYSVAAVEQRGVGYAVASDLSDRESAELVASVR